MRQDAQELVQRAGAILAAATFGTIARSTATEYRAVADRLGGERTAAGSTWQGPTAGIESRNSAAVRRAAWARRSVVEVAGALDDLRQRRVSVDVAVDHLASWVPEAERCPPLPRGDVDALHRGPSSKVRPIRSKRGGLRELPPDWLQQLWGAAVDAGHRHLNGIAVLLTTGCRPAEVAWGVAVRRVDAGIEVAIAGAKVTETAGQAWRRLTVADDVNGPVAHLLRLADAAPDGVARVGAGCSPAALSMAVTKLGEGLGMARRICAYDVRHQRCADARVAFSGDIQQVSAWLGHSGTETSRHYGRLPGGGCRGATPVAVSTAVPVIRRERTLRAQPDHASGPA
ncbi:MAG: hypothetical protein ACRYG8_10290 [Janthinobacterium lividum]